MVCPLEVNKEGHGEGHTGEEKVQSVVALRTRKEENHAKLQGAILEIGPKKDRLTMLRR